MANKPFLSPSSLSEKVRQTITIDLDLHSLQTIIEKSVTASLEQAVEIEVERVIASAFANSHQRDEFRYRHSKDDPMFAEGSKIIETCVFNALFDGQIEEMAKKCIVEQFPSILQKCITTAMEHKARRIAWDTIRSMKIPHEETENPTS